ncbi:hypothetical protein Tco_0970897 [Tanacetum coccineum]
MGGVGKEGEDGANEAFACRLREIEEFSWSSIDYKFLYRSLINLQDIRSGPSSTQCTQLASMDIHMASRKEQHTVNSVVLFHKVLNEMEKLDLE